MHLECIESNAWPYHKGILVLRAEVGLRLASSRCAHGQCKVHVLRSQSNNLATAESALRSCEVDITFRQYDSTCNKSWSACRVVLLEYRKSNSDASDFDDLKWL